MVRFCSNYSVWFPTMEDTEMLWKPKAYLNKAWVTQKQVMSEREKKSNTLCLKIHSGFQNNLEGSILSSDKQCWRTNKCIMAYKIAVYTQKVMDLLGNKWIFEMLEKRLGILMHSWQTYQEETVGWIFRRIATKLGWINLIIARFQITQRRLTKAHWFSSNVENVTHKPMHLGLKPFKRGFFASD